MDKIVKKILQHMYDKGGYKGFHNDDYRISTVCYDNDNEIGVYHVCHLDTNEEYSVLVDDTYIDVTGDVNTTRLDYGSSKKDREIQELNRVITQLRGDVIKSN